MINNCPLSTRDQLRAKLTGKCPSMYVENYGNEYKVKQCCCDCFYSTFGRGEGGSFIIVNPSTIDWVKKNLKKDD